MSLGVVIGLVVVAFVGSSVGRRPPASRASVRPACSVSILLLERAPLVLSQAVDSATGSLGFSHAAWDACEDVDGVPVGIDCRPGLGVHRRPLEDIVGERRHVRIVLPLTEGREAYGCARARVGEPYDGLSIFLTHAGGRRRGTICSELVFECLPESLRSRIEIPEGRPVAPNDIARAFGVASPSSPDVYLETA